mgnify:CR=1 FL=1
MANNPKAITALYLAVIFVFSLLGSCRTVEKVPEARLRPMNAVRLYKKAEDNSFDYYHFTIKKINISLDNGRSKTSFRASIQAVKGEAVLMSVTKLNILLAKVMLTPDSVVYVNYFDKSYYRGSYVPVSEMLKFDLDFNSIQAIISANIFSLFRNEKELRDFKTWNGNGLYVLQSETVRRLTRIEDKGKTQRVERILRRLDEEIPVIQTFYFDPSLFVIRKMEMEDKDSPRKAIIRFNDYEPVGGKYFPTTVEMLFQSDSSAIQVNSKLSGFSTDSGEFVPLRIPEKFERVFLN